MIPDYQTLMLPVLQHCADGEGHTARETVDSLGSKLGLTEEDWKELLPSGTQQVFANRIGWARTYLKKAGLLFAPCRGTLMITDRGRAVLKDPPDRINVKYLEQFEEFISFQSRSNKDEMSVATPDVPHTSGTPEEALETAYQQLRGTLADEILEKVKTSSPSFFERLVIELLVAMGYGGTRKDAGERIGQSGDEGIDGIIKEDRLGLDVIYIQAKRWEGSVGRPELQKFVGALQGQRARKGVFITTSTFTREAAEYVKHLDCKVILLDGSSLTQFMVDFNVGVSHVSSYEVKRIDMDYFSDEV